MKKPTFVFVLLTLLWGSSFLWIKIALKEVSPEILVAYRLSFASLACWALLKLRREKLPQSWADWRKVAFFACFNIVLPFFLISWAETKINSGTASLLNGCMPLFSFVGAHLFFTDERLSLSKSLALSLGFLGLVMLFGHGMNFSHWQDDLLPKLAVTGAAAAYGLSPIWSRKKLSHISALGLSSSTVMVSCAITWILVLLFSPRAFLVPQATITWTAIIWLGLLGTGVALLCFFYLIRTVGMGRASLVTYSFPVVGYFLGYVFLNERIGSTEVLGGLIVVSSVVWLNRKARILPQVLLKKTNRVSYR